MRSPPSIATAASGRSPAARAPAAPRSTRARSSTPSSPTSRPGHGSSAPRTTPSGPTYLRLEPGTTVGRGTTAHLRIQRPTVARQHARFERAGDRWFVEDLGSTNGTVVRGDRVVRAEVGDGDVIAVAGNEVVFRATLAPPPRAIDPTDDIQWSALFLDRIGLGFLEHPPPTYRGETTDRPVAVRAGTLSWSGYRDLTAADARWLFADAADAEVFTDVLLGGERDELPAPIVGDLCACFRAGAGLDIIVRTGPLVARLALSDASRDVDRLAALMVR